MSNRKRKARLTLSEQLAELSTPKPVSFHPDEDELADLTRAKVCDFPTESDEHFVVEKKKSKSRKYFDEFEDDPRYAGKAVARKELTGSEEEYSDDSLGDGKPGSMEDDQSDEEQDLIDNQSSSAEDENHEMNSVQSDSSSESEVTVQSKTGAEGISTISLDSLKEDIEKGKVAKHQLNVWDGLLETRIKLHKVLSACNQLPQGDALGQFTKAGGRQTEESVEECRLEVEKLMNDLLELQQLLLLRNSDTYSIVGGKNVNGNGNHGDEPGSDEEIPSDFSDNEESDNTGDESSSRVRAREGDVDAKGGSAKGGRRKRKHRDWVMQDGTSDYESYVSKFHESFATYRDQTITKWNTKTRIAGGKLTNKSFVQVDHSVLSQIKHIMADKPRLLKRTQLKRSVYRVLGSERGETVEGAGEEMDQSEDRRDLHLKDYDEEIFDDDDFYHQLLRELIERKMDLSESSDPVAMGRQWLQLQRLRAKAKKKVDTKASKGRKIRYNVHPQLTNYMVPIETGTMSDVSKNDLFSSLFGAHQETARTH